MPYKLKANAPEFDCVDGPFAGKKYRHGEVYAHAEIPPGDKGRFVETKHAFPVPEKTPAAKPVSKKNAVSEVKKAAMEKPKGGSK